MTLSEKYPLTRNWLIASGFKLEANASESREVWSKSDSWRTFSVVLCARDGVWMRNLVLDEGVFGMRMAGPAASLFPTDEEAHARLQSISGW